MQLEIKFLIIEATDDVLESQTHYFKYQYTCSCGCGWNSTDGVTGYVYHGSDCIGEACIAAWAAKGY